MKPITVEELAYLAGFIDGEGSFGISYSRGQGSFYVRISLTNTDHDGLLYVANLLQKAANRNDEVPIYWEPAKDNRRKLGIIQLQCATQVKAILLALQPYIVLKQKRLKLLLAFLKSEKNRKEGEFLYLAMKQLNGKGNS